MKKAKTLTQEQKLRAELKGKDELIFLQNGKVRNLNETIKKSEERINFLESVIEQNKRNYGGMMSVKEAEINRLVEIVRWQIKPETALKKEVEVKKDPMFGLMGAIC